MVGNEQANPRHGPWRREPDGGWIGTPDQLARAQILEIDRQTADDAVVVAPFCPDGLPFAATPAVTPAQPAARLWLGEREAVPMSIINNDDRQRYDDWRYPWGLVCRVNAIDGVGSGVLVGPRHVLTASHCVDWDDLRLTVNVHMHGTTPRATAAVERAGCFTKVVEGHGFDQVDEDYAVLVLDQRLGDKFGWMGVRTYESRWDERELWESFGYPVDHAGAGGTVPTWQPSVYLDEDAADYGWGRAMSTNADLYKGQSGSPMFSFWDDGPYAVAVLVAEVGDDNYCAGGVGLTALVNAVRALQP